MVELCLIIWILSAFVILMMNFKRIEQVPKEATLIDLVNISIMLALFPALKHLPLILIIFVIISLSMMLITRSIVK